ASGSSSARISTADLEQIRELHAQASEAQQDWQQALDSAGAIIREADRRAVGGAPAEGRSLRESMQVARDQEALASLEEQRARQRQEAEAGADRIRERQELEEAAQSPEVQTALALFFAPRSVQPRLSGSSIVMEKTF